MEGAEGSHGQACPRALHRPKLASYATSPATAAGSALQGGGGVGMVDEVSLGWE